MPTLNVLASFNTGAAAFPISGVIADSAGNLFGVTYQGGTGAGSVYEIVKTAGGYASTPLTLASFSGPDGAYPSGRLFLDSDGNLIGTTQYGGAGYAGPAHLGDGTVFELAKTAGGYASAPTVLVSFSESVNGAWPFAGVIADSAGNLLGVTHGDGNGDFGTVFEIAKTAGGYASTSTRLASLVADANLAYPAGPLMIDAAGNLFGTGSQGVTGGGGVFEIAKTAGGYASTASLLGYFTGPNGYTPLGGLVADPAGDLFGTTSVGGAYNDGTVFEMVKTAGGYGAPTTLVSFNFTDGSAPYRSLIIDAAGNLFGTTYNGGITSTDNPNGYGTVFEVAKTVTGYSSTPITLAQFSGANGSEPISALIVDGAGNLFGVTEYGGPIPNVSTGTVFEVTSSGYVVKTFTFTAGVDNLQGGPEGDAFFATANTLTKGDVAVGGSATNVLELQGGGTFDLRKPKTLTGIPVVTVTEGAGTDKPTVFLRAGLDVTVNVSSGTGASPGITIVGANDASVINLGGGTDTVTVGSASETIHGGGGVDTIKVNGTTIGATIDGGSGASVLTLTTAGPATMGANITNIHHVKLTMAAAFTANGLPGLTIVGSTGADTITAGGSGQTLTGGGGADTLIGWSGGGDTFADKTANLNGVTIEGFAAAGNAIDIPDMKATGAILSFSGGVLTVTNGGSQAQITLTGSFTQSDFHLGQDAKKHVLITQSGGTLSVVHTLAQAAAAMSDGGGTSAPATLSGTQSDQPLTLAHAA
jgi:hypothetical protein